MSQRIPELDGLRGVAVIMVLFYHYYGLICEFSPGTFGAYFARLVSLGWMGVDLFFVLSGFLVGGILIDQRKKENYFKVFWIRRSLRIFPPYVMYLMVYTLLRILPAETWNKMDTYLWGESIPFWALITYLQNFVMAFHGKFGAEFTAITWSLAVEEQYYLLFPLLIRWIPENKLFIAAFLLFLFAPGFRWALLYFGAPEFANQACIVLLPSRLDCLGAGLLAAIIVRNSSVIEKVAGPNKQKGLIVLLAGSSLGLFSLMNWAQTSENTIRFGLTWIAIVFSGIILALRFGWVPALSQILSCKILRFFGKISYSLYLFHMPFLLLVWILLRGEKPRINCVTDILFNCGILFISVLFASLSWKLLEARCIDYGHRFKYR